MKKILSLLLACVFVQTQCWALSGGPIYPGAGFPASGEKFVYGGAMIPRSGSNSMGVFFVSAPVGEIGTGQFSFFIEGELVTGEMTGTTDDQGNFSAVFQGATRETGDVTTSTTTGSTEGSLSEGTQTVVGPVPIGTIVGSQNIPPLIVDGVIVTGDITTSITDVGTTQNDSLTTTTTITPLGFLAGQLRAKIKTSPGSSSVQNSTIAAQFSGNGNLVMSTPSLRTQLKFKVQGSRQLAPADAPADDLPPGTPEPQEPQEPQPGQNVNGGGGFGLP